MGKRIIISEEEKKHILGKYQLNEDFQSSNGKVVAGGNEYILFTNGSERYYGGETSEGHKVCASVGWPCSMVPHKDLDRNVMKDLEGQMRSGKQVVSYTTPKNVKIEFKKV